MHDVSSKHVISLPLIHVSNMVVTLATGSSSFSSSLLLLGVSIQICSSLSSQDDVEEFVDDVSDDDDDDGRPEQAINSSSQFDSSLHLTHSSPNVSNALYIYVCLRVCVCKRVKEEGAEV